MLRVVLIGFVVMVVNHGAEAVAPSQLLHLPSWMASGGPLPAGDELSIWLGSTSPSTDLALVGSIYVPQIPDSIGDSAMVSLAGPRRAIDDAMVAFRGAYASSEHDAPRGDMLVTSRSRDQSVFYTGNTDTYQANSGQIGHESVTIGLPILDKYK